MFILFLAGRFSHICKIIVTERKINVNKICRLCRLKNKLVKIRRLNARLKTYATKNLLTNFRRCDRILGSIML